MAIAKSFQESSTHLLEEDVIRINLDPLILAMFTAFARVLTSRDIALNVANLLSELNLVIPENLNSEIMESLKNLASNKFLYSKNGEYLLTKLGGRYGKSALHDFRESVPEFFKN